MLGDLDELMAEGLDVLIDVDGEDVTVRNVVVKASVSEVVEDPSFGAGNLGNTRPGRRCTILFPIRDFTPPLRKGDLVTARGKKFKIDTPTIDRTSISLLVVEHAGN